MATYSALIIGAGNIGALYDSPESEDILTHAHAYSESEDFELRGFVDTSLDAATNAASIWGCRAYGDIDHALKKEKPDVVSVCVSDAAHENVLDRVLTHHPHLVFSEKPLANTANKARKIVDTYNNAGIPLLVNYSRRFVPKIRRLAESARTGCYGAFICGQGLYGKGLLHNGSHMIDLLHQFLGRIDSADKIDKISDESNIDPSISAVIRFGETGRFHLQAVDSKIVTIFEVDLVFKQARIQLTNSCATAEEFAVSTDQKYRGYRVFQSQQTESTMLTTALPNALINIFDHLENGLSLACSGDDAHAVIDDCELILNGNKCV